MFKPSSKSYETEINELNRHKACLRKARDAGYYPEGGDAHLVLDLNDIDGTPLERVLSFRGVTLFEEKTTFAALSAEEQRHWLTGLLQKLSNMRVWKRDGSGEGRMLSEF